MIPTEDIVVIAQNILATMLDIEAIPIPHLEHDAPASDSRKRVTGFIQISGQWQGAVVIQCTESLAKLFASRLLETTPEDLIVAEVLDAFAEMTNMIGGNIHGQVPEPSYLSIPSVTTGQEFDDRLAGATAMRDLSLECEGELLRILLFEEVQHHDSPKTYRKIVAALS